MKPNRVLRCVSLLVVASLALTAQVARQETVVPLKNWTTPLYWQPNQTEREATSQALPRNGGPQLVFSANQVSSNALTFIAITPCRLIDTRGAAANFNGIAPFSGPSIPATMSVTFPVQSAAEAAADTTPAPCGTIPSIAQAYSLNLTVVPVAGGAVDYISMWPSGYSQPFVATLNDPQGAVVANAAIVPAGTVNGGISVYNQGPATANIIIDMNGFFAAPTDLNFNTAVGAEALASNPTGMYNTAIGYFALTTNTTGSQNTAIGAGALSSNTTGSDNAASGTGALNSNTTGSNNTASGNGALSSNTTGQLNTATGQAALNNNTTGSNNTATGQAALQSNITGSDNTATGEDALAANTTGAGNTADGVFVLHSNTSGMQNTASGQNALGNNTTGNFNAAFGTGVLSANTTACCNTGVGQIALSSNLTGNSNTAIGESALQNNTTGGGNTAVGDNALVSNTTGGGNIAIGYNAALSVAAGNGNNIHIGSQGVSGDNAAIRIGTQGTQTSAYIAGIWNNTPNVTNLLVCVDANGELGTTGCTSTPSSRRFKEQITDMGDSSSKLLQLRPVTFFYKPQYDDGSHALQYGLIAEEVAPLFPDMVGYDKDGEPNSVKYQSLAPMLLNEVQKEAAQNRQQAEQIRQQAEVNRLQQEQNRKLEERLAAVETLLSAQAATATRAASSQ